jgi:hypothetical protein
LRSLPTYWNITFFILNITNSQNKSEEYQIQKIKLTNEQLAQLKSRLSLEEDNKYHFLGYALDLQKGIIQDQIFEDSRQTKFDAQILTVLLAHYVSGKPTPTTSILIKFNKLQGGYAYERAFNIRATQPIAKAFGERPFDLVEAGKKLGGLPLNYGHSSIQIPTIEGIPIVYILWAESEFPASTTVLFDQSANNYLPTEDLAVLTELTSSRLIKAKSKLSVP